jgi:hypothetical protein
LTNNKINLKKNLNKQPMKVLCFIVLLLMTSISFSETLTTKVAVESFDDFNGVKMATLVERANNAVALLDRKENYI